MNYGFEELYSLSGMTGLITGAGGQIGRDMVQAVTALGGRCLASDASAQALDSAATRCSWDPDAVTTMEADIRDQNAVAALMDEGTRLGGLDFLVNNAGVSVFEPFLDRPEASIEWVMDVNLKGTIICTKEFMRHRKDQGGGGCVVNVASHYGLISPDPRIYTDCDRKNSEIYGATKAGLIQMTRYYAVHAAEFAVRVNAVSPGGVLNPDNPQGPDFQSRYGFRCPMGRMAETGEVVGAVLFLLSPAASYINGHNLVVDGGMTCW